MKKLHWKERKSHFDELEKGPFPGPKSAAAAGERHSK